MRSPVTTKRGDQGMTTAISGLSYPKSHLVIECSGRVDALRAHTALARLRVLESGRADAAESAEFLFWLLHVCFLIGAQCSDPLDRHPEYRHEDMGPGHLAKLEAFQAALEGRVTLPRSFIVSASSVLAAELDVATTVARDLEREIVRLKEAFPEFNAEHILVFVNRLSDSLFMLARSFEDGIHTAVDYSSLERFGTLPG